MTHIRKKLIEVALPLDAINVASAREKSIRHGHPSTLHLWWARRPLAAARAVIFAQMVDDPSEHTDVLLSDPAKKRAATRELHKRLEAWNRRKAAYEAARGQGNGNVPDPGPEPTLEGCVADLERERLFKIIAELVKWESTTNEEVLQRARDEIWQSWRYTCAENADHPRARELFDRHKLPAFHDPFAGGGALPLEAQRLGLEAYASDLNPVAVLINKAMIEIPPKFANRPPVNPEARAEQRLIAQTWKGAQGLAEDVRYYGKWMRDEAEKRIGHLYPKVEITAEMAVERPDLKPYVGQKLTVIAWLWARTVKSPNPAFADVDVPLASTFMLSTKPGKEAYVEPVIEDGGYRFMVKVGKPKNAEVAKNGTKLARGANFQCVMSGIPIAGDYIKTEGVAGRMGARLMAIVAEGDRRRLYLPPTEAMEAVAAQAKPDWKPENELVGKCRDQLPLYGMDTFADIFTSRQLVALTTFSDLVQEARARVRSDAVVAGLTDDGKSLDAGGTGAQAYADAVAVYLAFAISKLADRGSTICTWFTDRDSTRNTFARQSIQMTWDYAELNTLLDGTGSFFGAVNWTAESIEGVAAGHGATFGSAVQIDATSQTVSSGRIVSTDPPYCLAPGTLIQTPEGYRPIEHIQVGDRVLTHAGRFAQVTHTYQRPYCGSLDQLKIAHTSQALLITGEHPVYAVRTGACTVGYADYCHVQCAWQAQNGNHCSVRLADGYRLEWIPASEIRANDLIFTPTLQAQDTPQAVDLIHWLPAASYTEFEGALHYQKATPRSLARREAESAPPRRYAAPAHVALSPELCRLIGYFVADGYARVESDGGAIQFTFHVAEEQLVADVEALMALCFGLSPGRVTDNRVRHNQSVRINFYSKPVAQLLRSWCYTETGLKRLPEWALSLDATHVCQIIRGYWAGDGFRANGNYIASTNSPHLAGQLRLLLQRIQINARLHIRQVKPSVVNGKMLISRGPHYGLYVNGPSLMRLAEIVGAPKNQALSTRRHGQHGAWWEGGYLLPVRGVARVEYEGLVYNLETEDHSYVTAAGCVHNCDNIGYADLSDFFYVWLRRSLRAVFPGLFATLAVPKAEELVSTPYRHGSKLEAEAFFLTGMTQAMRRLAEQTHPAYPVTIYYAYKQAETENTKVPGMTFTGWETFLEAVIQAGFIITGTWPMRTELSNRMIGNDTNALASSIILVCRRRAAAAPTATRREFVSALKAELPAALAHLQRANIAPVDLAQAAIGPGMAVYTRYARVLDAAGNPVPVREALALINQTLDEALAEQEGDFDADSRWALAWFEQSGFAEGEYGVAETLSKAKNTSVAGMVEAGILVSSRGKVRLLKPNELPANWDPAKDRRLTAWESVHQLIRALETGGEAGAAELAAKLGSQAETARELAYRLYTLCERKKRAAEALSYNALVQSWPEIMRLARAEEKAQPAQSSLFDPTGEG